jgi:hypothetical protein
MPTVRTYGNIPVCAVGIDDSDVACPFLEIGFHGIAGNGIDEHETVCTEGIVGSVQSSHEDLCEIGLLCDDTCQRRDLGCEGVCRVAMGDENHENQGRWT